MNIDLLPPRSGPSSSRRGLNVKLLVLLTILATVLVWWLLPAEQPSAPVAQLPAELSSGPVVVDRTVIEEGEIDAGATMTSLLGRFLSPQDIYLLDKQAKPVFPLTRLKAGQAYRLKHLDEQFVQFAYDIDQDDMLIIDATDDGSFTVVREPIPYTVRVDHIKGTIQSSLFEAVTSVGEEAELALALADIFAWDIDFILDIRVGDSFQALVEKRFRDGEWAGYGKILAAEFVNRGEPFNAFRFKDGDRSTSYYDEEGNSVRKAFLKAPLAFSRISSGFSMKRFHPITKTWKAHPAIDYAAPTGTPIKAVGDGTISRIGYTRGNGNFIEIRHNSSYKTIYLHMSRFSRKMKKGRRVDQGQVIGFVGSTGLATGPHLCFRMYRNGSPVNPTRIKSPSVAPVSGENREKFLETIRAWVARFSVPTQEGQASAQQPESVHLN